MKEEVNSCGSNGYLFLRGRGVDFSLTSSIKINSVRIKDLKVKLEQLKTK